MAITQKELDKANEILVMVHTHMFEPFMLEDEQLVASEMGLVINHNSNEYCLDEIRVFPGGYMEPDEEDAVELSRHETFDQALIALFLAEFGRSVNDAFQSYYENNEYSDDITHDTDFSNLIKQ